MCQTSGRQAGGTQLRADFLQQYGEISKRLSAISPADMLSNIFSCVQNTRPRFSVLLGLLSRE